MWQQIITKPGGWLHAHPWTVVAFLAGLVAGVCVAKLIAGFPSADAIASIFGAGVGSAMAVLGAVWVANREERNRRKLLLSSLATITKPTVIKVQALLDLLTAEGRDNVEARSMLQEAHELVQETQLALVNLQPLFTRNVTESVLYLLIARHYANLMRQIEFLVQEAGTTANRMYPSGWSRTDFSELDKASKSLERDTRFIL